MLRISGIESRLYCGSVAVEESKPVETISAYDFVKELINVLSDLDMLDVELYRGLVYHIDDNISSYRMAMVCTCIVKNHIKDSSSLKMIDDATDDLARRVGFY